MRTAKIQRLDSGVKAYTILRISFGEIGQFGQQPVMGQCRIYTDVDRSGAFVRERAVRGVFQPVEGICNFVPECPALFSQSDRALPPFKKLDSKIVFKRADLLADGHLADTHVVCRCCKGAMPRRNGESSQLIQREVAIGFIHNQYLSHPKEMPNMHRLRLV